MERGGELEHCEPDHGRIGRGAGSEGQLARKTLQHPIAQLREQIAKSLVVLGRLPAFGRAFLELCVFREQFEIGVGAARAPMPIAPSGENREQRGLLLDDHRIGRLGMFEKRDQRRGRLARDHAPHHAGHDPFGMQLGPAGDEFSGGRPEPRGEIVGVAMTRQPPQTLGEPRQVEEHGQVHRGLVLFGQTLAEQFVGLLGQHAIALRRLEHGERRIELGLDRMGAEERVAKGVDRGDAGRIEAADHRGPMLGFFISGRPQAIVARAANAIAHLARGGIGKRDRHHVADLARIERLGKARIELGQKPLREHEGLAAAGAGRKRDR